MITAALSLLVAVPHAPPHIPNMADGSQCGGIHIGAVANTLGLSDHSDLQYAGARSARALLCYEAVAAIGGRDAKVRVWIDRHAYLRVTLRSEVVALASLAEGRAWLYRRVHCCDRCTTRCVPASKRRSVVIGGMLPWWY